MKSNHILKNIVSIAFILILGACSTKNNPVGTNPEDDEIKKDSFIKYTFISKASFYKQSTILCKHEYDLIRFGTDKPIQIYNLLNNSWLDIPLYDSSFARWDGAAVNIDGVIFIIGTSTKNHSYDILKYFPTTKTYEHTGIELPKYFDYPAFCKYNNHIVFFSSVTDSVYKYDPERNKLSKIADNPFYTNGNHVYKLFSSGNYQNYFYVFDSSGGNSSTSADNSFYRLNLLNNVWEKISIPIKIAKKKLFGASMGGQMILFCDSVSTYRYSYESSDWSVDKSPVPIFPRTLLGTLDYGEWSFYSEDTCLYGSEIWSQSIWKISLNK